MAGLMVGFLVVVGVVLIIALGMDLWDRRNGREPTQRVEAVRSRKEYRRTVRTSLSSRRLGVGSSLESQFQAPPDDHDIRPERRRPR